MHHVFCQWDSPGKDTGVGWVSFPPPGNLQYLGTEPLSPALQADVFTAALSGKPHSIWVSAYLWGGVRLVKEGNKKGAGCCW